MDVALMKVAVLAAAVLLAIVANVVVHAIVTGPLGEPLLMCEDCSASPPTVTPMPVGDAMLFSALFGSAAVAAYAVIDARSAHPLKIFTVVATVALPASLLLPARIPSPPVTEAARLTLMAMHVVGCAAILGTLWVACSSSSLLKRFTGGPSGPTSPPG
jgi:Family of unknown function (DUF6069)